MEMLMKTEAATQEKIDEPMEEETHGRLEKMLLIYPIDYYFSMFSQSYPWLGPLNFTCTKFRYHFQNDYAFPDLYI